MILAGIVVCE